MKSFKDYVVENENKGDYHRYGYVYLTRSEIKHKSNIIKAIQQIVKSDYDEFQTLNIVESANSKNSSVLDMDIFVVGKDKEFNLSDVRNLTVILKEAARKVLRRPVNVFVEEA